MNKIHMIMFALLLMMLLSDVSGRRGRSRSRSKSRVSAKAFVIQLSHVAAALINLFPCQIDANRFANHRKISRPRS
jgi:hypothetical protein